MIEFLPWTMVFISFAFAVWQSIRSNELADELKLTTSHAARTQASYERSRKQEEKYLAALREQKIRADKYRSIARKLNRKMREQNKASKPAEIFYGESLQAATSAPMQTVFRFHGVHGSDKIKVGG